MFARIVVYFSFFVVVSLNIILIRSSVVGFISSVIYVYLSSFLLGNVLFRDEVFWHRIVFGFSFFIVLLGLGGSVALGLYVLTDKIIVLLLFAITSLSIALTVKAYGLKALFSDKFRLKTDEPVNVSIQKSSFVFTKEHLLQIFYVFLVVTCFVLLFLSRSEETFVFWGVVQPAFLPLYFVATLVLLTILFSKVRKGTKLLFIIVHCFLIHNLLVIVLNPGLEGDWWYELGWARSVYDVGKNVPNILDYVFGSVSYNPIQVIYFALRKRALQVFSNIFANMFAVDVYWSQLFLVPILWTIIVPFLMYKIVKILGGEEKCAIFGGFLTFLVPAFIWWGAITVSDTLGKIFFLLATYFTFKYVASSDRNLKAVLFAFLATYVALSTHFLNGIMSFVGLLLAIAYKIYESNKTTGTKALLIATLGASSVFLPLTLLALGAVYPLREETTYFSVEKLLETDILALVFGKYVNFTLSDLFLNLLFPVLGFIGLMYIIVFSTKHKYKRSLALFSLLLLVIFMIDYRITKYAMERVLFSSERMWVFRDLVILPFAALFVVHAVGKLYDRVRVSPRVQKHLSFFMHACTIVTLIFCLALSGFAVVVARSAYSYEPQILQVTPYEVEAVKYIHENTPEKYVVICSSLIQKLAYGVLGWENGPHFTPTSYYSMLRHPSVSIIESTMRDNGASVGYFVTSVRNQKGFDRAVSSARKVLEIYAVFGDGKMYVFRYPNLREELTVPLMVDSGGVVRENYVVENEVNVTRLLYDAPSGHLDPNSFRVKREDGSELPTQFDGFQAVFYDCSSADSWLRGVSDGDLIIHSTVWTNKTREGEKVLDVDNLAVDIERYRYLEVKWAERPDDVAVVRLAFHMRNLSHPIYRWGNPTSEWSIRSYDLSELNGTLWRFRLDLYDVEPGYWSGNYTLYVDWIRFISDVGTVRWLYNSTIDTSIEQYQLVYDFFENTESLNLDGAPRKYNITFNNDENTPPPHVDVMFLKSLNIRSVDLVGQPVDNVMIEIKELNQSATTNAEGWAFFKVSPGVWTLTVSGNGNTGEKTMEVLSDFVTLVKVDSIKIDGVTMGIWKFGLLITFVTVICALSFVFLHKRWSSTFVIHGVDRMGDDLNKIEK